jgi:hypothetical protein
LSRSQVEISSKTGAEGINLDVCGDFLKIINDHEWNQFAEEIVLQLKRGKTGEIPVTFFETYSWPGIIENINKKIKELNF